MGSVGTVRRAVITRLIATVLWRRLWLAVQPVFLGESFDRHAVVEWFAGG
jgi:hypothetical protein